MLFFNVWTIFHSGISNLESFPSLVSVVVDSSDITFQYYSSGIYCSSKCSKRKPNHAMLVVGYGSEDGVDYWILKNRYKNHVLLLTPF